jgi:hypothetical protein
MSNLNGIETIESDITTWEREAPVSAVEKAATSKPKPKTPKPKAVAKPTNSDGPIYLLLFANGKYKELRESELNAEAASVLKDPTLRLVKGRFLIPQISFKVADEE